MKKILFVIFFNTTGLLLFAQNKTVYPTPEFSNEIYFFKKDSGQVSRLEKGYSKIETKSKMGGMGGVDNGYSLDGSKSPVRLQSGNMSFIYFSGNASSDQNSQSDSMMKANGMDPNAMGDAMSIMSDPSRTTSLYNMSAEKGARKVTLQSYSGMKIMGKSKKESTKYTLSIKKVRSGYYEMMVDKILPKGEYAFIVNDFSSANGSTLLFAFGVD